MIDAKEGDAPVLVGSGASGKVKVRQGDVEGFPPALGTFVKAIGNREVVPSQVHFGDGKDVDVVVIYK